MRKLLISLMFVLSTSLAFGQKYQGDINLNLQLIGLSASTSHGVSFTNDYIGAGVEIGGLSIIVDVREWVAAYADYRHLFDIGNKGNSFFVQVAPGISRTSSDMLFSMVLKERNNKGGVNSEIANCFYAKVGAGFQWNWTNTGLNLGIYCSYFGDKIHDSLRHFYPSMGLTFHW